MRHGPVSWEWVNALGCWVGRDAAGGLWYAYPVAPTYAKAREAA